MSPTTTNIGILSALGSNLLCPILIELQKQTDISITVFLDGELTQKLKEISNSRIDPEQPIPSLSELPISRIPFHFVSNHNSPDAIDLYKLLGCEYLLNGGTPRILTKDTISATKGILNCHPGILPKYRGCTALEWSLYHHDPVGATIHLISSAIDEGPILFSEILPPIPGENYKQLRTRMVWHQARLIANAVNKLSNNEISLTKLEAQGPGGYFKPIPDKLLRSVIEQLEKSRA